MSANVCVTLTRLRKVANVEAKPTYKIYEWVGGDRCKHGGMCRVQIQLVALCFAKTPGVIVANAICAKIRQDNQPACMSNNATLYTPARGEVVRVVAIITRCDIGLM